MILQDTVALADWKRAYLRGNRLAEPGWRPGTWREHTPDSIRVVMNGKYASIVFTLLHRAEPLSGMIDYTSHVLIRDSTGVDRPYRSIRRASARTQPCPADSPR
jgi:hypothetical protein